MKCPHCNSENTQSYEAIFSKEYRTYNSKHNNSYGTSYTNGHSVSPLGQKVFPPVKKKIRYFALLLNILGYVYVFRELDIINYITNIERVTKKGAIPFNIFYILYTIFIVSYTVLSIKRFIYNKNRYPHLYRNWLTYWYCHKCGQGFSRN